MAGTFLLFAILSFRNYSASEQICLFDDDMGRSKLGLFCEIPVIDAFQKVIGLLNTGYEWTGHGVTLTARFLPSFIRNILQKSIRIKEVRQ